MNVVSLFYRFVLTFLELNVEILHFRLGIKKGTLMDGEADTEASEHTGSFGDSKEDEEAKGTPPAPKKEKEKRTKKIKQKKATKKSAGTCIASGADLGGGGGGGLYKPH